MAGYGIYALEDVIPVTGYGLTEEEAKKDFVEQIKEQADYYKKKGTYPEWYEENLLKKRIRLEKCRNI